MKKLNVVNAGEVEVADTPERIYVGAKAAAIPMNGVYTLSSHEGDIEYVRADIAKNNSVNESPEPSTEPTERAAETAASVTYSPQTLKLWVCCACLAPRLYGSKSACYVCGKLLHETALYVRADIATRPREVGSEIELQGALTWHIQYPLQPATVVIQFKDEAAAIKFMEQTTIPAPQHEDQEDFNVGTYIDQD